MCHKDLTWEVLVIWSYYIELSKIAHGHLELVLLKELESS